MAVPGFYNAADQTLYDQGNYFLPQEQYRLNLGTDTGVPNKVEFNPSQEGIGSLQQSYPFPYYDQEVGGDNNDDDDEDKKSPPGSKGVGSLLDRYNQTNYLGRSLVNMPIGMFAPQLAPLLGMYNMGKSVYDFGRNVLGYNKAATNMRYDFDGNIADARSGSYSTNPGIGFSNRDPEDTNPNLGNENENENETGYDSSGGYGGGVTGGSFGE